MNSQDFQPYLDIAISVLERKDVSAVAKLKAFLASLPGPSYIEQALGLAVVHVAENDHTVFDWVVSNQILLSPELDLKTFTQRLVQQRLNAKGWVHGRDFTFESGRFLLPGQNSFSDLESVFSEGELKLLFAAFSTDSSLSA